MLDTPTWRANLDWGARLGYDAVRLADVNRRAVEFVRELAADAADGPTVVIDGVIGPRGDGYVVGATMSAAEAAAYHGLQARAFAEAGADDDHRHHDDLRRRGDRRRPCRRRSRRCRS